MTTARVWWLRNTVCAAMCASCLLGPAAAWSADGELSLGTARTWLGHRALLLAAEYGKKWNGQELLNEIGSGERDSHWLFYFAPETEIRTGDNDAFQGVTVKLTGSALRMRETVVDGVTTLDTRMFMAFPISAGIESDAEFHNVAAITEAGVVPWFQGMAPALLKSAFVGVFIQAGEKFSAHDDTAAVAGGAADQSEEPVDDGILRFKASARLATPKFLVSKYFPGITVSGTADYWHDLAHTADYRRVTAKLRLFLADNESFDWTYEKGAGAPTFNKGEQFSASLTLAF